MTTIDMKDPATRHMYALIGMADEHLEALEQIVIAARALDRPRYAVFRDFAISHLEGLTGLVNAPSAQDPAVAEQLLAGASDPTGNGPLATHPDQMPLFSAAELQCPDTATDDQVPPTHPGTPNTEVSA